MKREKSDHFSQTNIDEFAIYANSNFLSVSHGLGNYAKILNEIATSYIISRKKREKTCLFAIILSVDCRIFVD